MSKVQVKVMLDAADYRTLASHADKLGVASAGELLSNLARNSLHPRPGAEVIVVERMKKRRLSTDKLLLRFRQLWADGLTVKQISSELRIAPVVVEVWMNTLTPPTKQKESK